ncbi:MAG: hypothetical protein KGI69_00675 [Patescibacteria group bacterium]|nr:hypothetical protein [Patescibacteria group bacterium]
MNKKIIVIFGLTVIALIIVYLYSFGPLAGLRTALSINPASQKPIIVNQNAPVTGGGAAATTTANVALVQEFKNRDMVQNYYHVSLPADWHATSTKPGEYAVSYPGGSGTIGLIDIPDNSTPELFILSQQEPALKKLPGYSKVSYASTTVNGNISYKLVYDALDNGVAMTHERAYITGQDHAALIDLSAPASAWPNMSGAIEAVIGSFHWDQ